jgi:hypothetical protein
MTTLCRFDWIIEDRVFFVKWPEVINEDVIEYFKNEMEHYLLPSSASKVHFISDMRLTKQLPGLTTVRDNAALITNDKMGWVMAMASSNTLIRMLVSIITRIFPIHVRFVDTLEEAAYCLNEVDPTLPDLRAYHDQIEAFASVHPQPSN